MHTFTMVGCTLFKFCHFKCAEAYLLEILGMSRLWHDLMAHGQNSLKSQFLDVRMPNTPKTFDETDPYLGICGKCGPC